MQIALMGLVDKSKRVRTAVWRKPEMDYYRTFGTVDSDGRVQYLDSGDIAQRFLVVDETLYWIFEPPREIREKVVEKLEQRYGFQLKQNTLNSYKQVSKLRNRLRKELTDAA